MKGKIKLFKISALFIMMILSMTFLTSCMIRYQYFSNKELAEVGLTGLPKVPGAKDYCKVKSITDSRYKKCNMNIPSNASADDFVVEVLKMLDNKEIYKFYAYDGNEEMYTLHRTLHLSKDPKDYLMYDNPQDEGLVKSGFYHIFYALTKDAENKTMYEITVSRYSKDDPRKPRDYNCTVGIYEHRFSNYTLITEEE